LIPAYFVVVVFYFGFPKGKQHIWFIDYYLLLTFVVVVTVVVVIYCVGCRLYFCYIKFLLISWRRCVRIWVRSYSWWNIGLTVGNRADSNRLCINWVLQLRHDYRLLYDYRLRDRLYIYRYRGWVRIITLVLRYINFILFESSFPKKYELLCYRYYGVLRESH